MPLRAFAGAQVSVAEAFTRWCFHTRAAGRQAPQAYRRVLALRGTNSARTAALAGACATAGRRLLQRQGTTCSHAPHVR